MTFRLCRVNSAEMTQTMQTKLRKLSSKEIQDSFRVTRSDELGSKGLYTLVKQPLTGPKASRPRSLQLAAGLTSAFSLKTPKSGYSLFGLLTPNSPAVADTDRQGDSYFG